MSDTALNYLDACGLWHLCTRDPDEAHWWPIGAWQCPTSALDAMADQQARAAMMGLSLQWRVEQVPTPLADDIAEPA